MKKWQLALLIICALMMLQQGASAQFLWQVQHSDFDGRYYYAFDAVSSSGNNYTVAGELFDTVNQKIIRMCWRSNDGGLIWQMQDPKLPPYSGTLPPFGFKYFSTIQQIDSLNAVAAGDAGLLIRTFDGGKTWEKQDTKTSGTIRDINFSDSLNGILLSQENNGVVIADGIITIHTTTDGGRNWDTAKFNHNRNAYSDFVSCKAFGNGKYRLFRSYLGIVYTTLDNWNSIDTTKPIFDTANKYYQIVHCNLSSGDTILAYGALNGVGILIRSTDAGASWSNPVMPNGKISAINHMTSLDRDTVLAGGVSNNKIILSTDRGISWRVDSLLLDTSYLAYSNNGIAWSENGRPIAIFAPQTVPGIPSIMIRENSIKSHVETIDISFEKVYLYPNPASSFVNIFSVDGSSPIIIMDVLGREVLRGFTTPQGNLKLDVSSLPLGIYDVLLDRKGRRLFVQKLDVLGK